MVTSTGAVVTSPSQSELNLSDEVCRQRDFRSPTEGSCVNLKRLHGRHDGRSQGDHTTPCCSKRAPASDTSDLPGTQTRNSI
jgi:hypothetical protein